MSEITQTRAMDDYFHSLLIDDLLQDELLQEEAPTLVPARQPLAIRQRAAPYAEVEPERRAQLSELLAQVSKVRVDMDALGQEPQRDAFALASEVNPVPSALAAEPEPRVEIETETVLPQALAEVATPLAPPEVQTASLEAAVVAPAPEAWQNIEVGNEFQALFFEVAGVTFAVPLMELGGIHQLGEVSALFGQPKWYRGIMTQREQQMSVVDTALWVMPDQELEVTDYQYLIMLGESNWGLACHHLKGTELLHRDQVKWRHQEGKRPWLAGMVKEKMCALLHVRELLVLLARGVNITGR
ncbi:chemotaxis protein CheW [Aeromonas bivalvium]|uniref:chemotaxis protein CheW n=1 Tax=Aeromonas bivalvium TaxID=440079 RepID=UPI000DD012FF|nr:chemotaxis protein CheW [Aeromonas bivalvium]